MKKVIFVILIVIELFMGMFTYLVFDSESAAMILSGGSFESTTEFFGPKFWVVFLLFLATISSTFYFRKKLLPLLISFLIFFSFWLLCGRTIGVHWTGEIYTGWYYIFTDKIVLHENAENCAGDIIECTTAKNSNFFHVVLINGEIENDIFVGGMIQLDLMRYFNQKGAEQE